MERQKENHTQHYDVILLDSSSLLNSLYFGLKNKPNHLFKKVNGENTDVTMLRSYVGALLSLQKEFPNAKIIHVLDPEQENNNNFRKHIYPEYKANRPEKEIELKKQLKLMPRLLTYLGQPFYQHNDYEADDLISTLTLQVLDKNQKVLIYSKDTDLFQIMVDEDKVHFLNKFQRSQDPKTKQIYIDKSFVSSYAQAIEKIGIHPLLLPEMLALCGDSSDNIPNPKGLGQKTAINILNKFKNIENFLIELEKGNAFEFKKFFDEPKNKEMIIKNMQLTTTVFDIKGLKNLYELEKETKQQHNMEGIKRVSTLLNIEEKFLKRLVQNNLEKDLDNALNKTVQQSRISNKPSI